MATDALSVIESLGVAWSVFGLYPNPVDQPAFTRALDAIHISDPVVYGVGPDGASVGEAALEITSEGTRRLLRQCFLHDVQRLRVNRVPSTEEASGFFEIIAKSEEEVAERGGVRMMLTSAGIEALTVVERTSLQDHGGDEFGTGGSGSGTTPSYALQAVPAALDEIKQMAEGDPGAVAAVFLPRFREVMSDLPAEDVWTREHAVRTFVNGIFELDDPAQAAVVDSLLHEQDDLEAANLLDQFAGHELARLAPDLSPAAFDLLLSYAQLSRHEADPRPEELMSLLQPEAIETARRQVGSAMTERLGDEALESEMYQVIGDSLPEPRQLILQGLEVFRALLHVEDRDGRFNRLLRIWQGKVRASVERSEYGWATLWVKALRADPTYPDLREIEVDAFLRDVMQTELVDLAVRDAVDGADSNAFLVALGKIDPDALIDRLDRTESPQERRVLTAVLAEVASGDPRPIVARIGSAPWYLARNLATVLGDCHHPDAEQPLATLLEHHDHRVRGEAVRSIATLLGPEAYRRLQGALHDKNDRVRRAAAGILAQSSEEPARELLLEELRGRRFSVEEKERLIDLMVQTPSDDLWTALETLAQPGLKLSSGQRQIREKAQEALRARN